MAASTDFNIQTGGLQEVFARLNQMESRMLDLEESVKKAVGTMMPKVEALLSARNGEDVLASSAAGPSTNTVSSSSSSPSPLLESAERGDDEVILRILTDEQNYTRNIQVRTEDGDTALHVAASRGHFKAVIVLLGAVKVDAPGHRMRTPLHCAATQGHPRVAQRLLDVGAQVDVEDANGATALDLAVEEDNSEVVEVLLQSGARVNEKNIFTAVTQGSKSLVEMLLKKGARVSNETVFTAVSEDRGDLVELFLSKGVSADLCNKEGESLLLLACRAEKRNMVELLLKRGASATKCKTADECALRYAAEGGQADTVRLLSRHGAASDSMQVQYGLRFAKSAAVVWAFLDVVPQAVRGEAGTRGLVEAGCNGRVEPLLALLDAGVDIDARDRRNQTALFLAAAAGQVACVRELLRRGADVHAKGNKGDTPLHAASMCDEAECVRALLAAGASTTEKNNARKTPVEVAVSDAVRQLFNVTIQNIT